MFVRKGILVN